MVRINATQAKPALSAHRGRNRIDLDLVRCDRRHISEVMLGVGLVGDIRIGSGAILAQH